MPNPNIDDLATDVEIIDEVSPSVDRSDLKYPISNQTEIGNWITFTRKKYKKVDMLSDSQLVDAEDSRVIILPLPPQLNTNVSAEWDTDSTGIWNNFLRENVGESINRITENLNSGGTGNLVTSIQEDIKNYTLKGVSNGLLNVIQKYGREFVLNNEVFKKTGTFTGMARNPYKAVLYNSPNFRSYNFNYKLMPKNYQEALAIKNIIKEFKIGMSPDFEGAFVNDVYAYPDLFEIKITNDEFLFKFAPCVCKSVQVDYHAEGIPSYIKGPSGEKIPSSITLQLDLMETAILTRKQYKDEGY